MNTPLKYKCLALNGVILESLPITFKPDLKCK